MRWNSPAYRTAAEIFKKVLFAFLERKPQIASLSLDVDHQRAGGTRSFPSKVSTRNAQSSQLAYKPRQAVSSRVARALVQNSLCIAEVSPCSRSLFRVIRDAIESVLWENPKATARRA